MKIAFIINPVSGTRQKESIVQMIHKEFYAPQYEVKIAKTQYPGHAVELAKELGLVCNIVVAVGGDGTLNEVAQGILETEAILGIVPCGSGNGLARHLKIPINAKKALNKIKRGETNFVDVLFFNGSPFLNVSGIGFDAKVAHNFAKSAKRGLLSYIKQVVKLYFSFQPIEASIKWNAQIIHSPILLIAFANSSQFGNNAVISPISDVSDGLFESCVIKPFPFWAIPFVIVRLFTKTMHYCKYVEIIQSKEISITTTTPIESHIDGTPYIIDTVFDLHIIKHGIKIIV